jgi:hypothetical protein
MGRTMTASPRIPGRSGGAENPRQKVAFFRLLPIAAEL